jgi:hypothetical protein
MQQSGCGRWICWALQNLGSWRSEQLAQCDSMFSLLVLAIWTAVVCGVAWYSARVRQTSPELSNAGYAIVVSLSLAFLNGPGWAVILIGLLSGQDLTEFSEDSALRAFWPELIAVSLAGVLLVFYAIRKTSHAAAKESDSKLRTKRVCQWLVIAYFVALASVTYVVLTLNYDTYGYNRLRDTRGLAMGSAAKILFVFFTVPYLALMWLPFAAVYFAFSKFVLAYDIKLRTALLLLAASLICFSLPYLLMLDVLAFDLMEMDFPGSGVTSSTSITYYNYFLVLAPVVGILFTLPWLFGSRRVLRSRQSRPL